MTGGAYIEGPAAGARVFCVLGKSRSGTSLTTRVLNVLGVSLGQDESLMPAAANNNPKGFWEHRGIAALNEAILSKLCDTPPQIHQAWRSPPRLEPAWERAATLDPQRETAQWLLRESFAGQPIWGWKDPRTCLTLPFWRQLVPAMRFVICVRHPLDVAASLRARDDMQLEEALRLWLLYTSSAILNTRGWPRLVVSYESYFHSWERQAERLACFIGQPTLSSVQRAAIAEHCEQGLWHHRDGSSRAATVPEAVGSLYASLVALAELPGAAGPDADAALDALARRAARRS